MRDRSCTDPSPQGVSGSLCVGPGTELQNCISSPCQGEYRLNYFNPVPRDIFILFQCLKIHTRNAYMCVHVMHIPDRYRTTMLK